MKKILLLIVALLCAFAFGYVAGQAQTKIEIAEKQTEVVKNAAKKRALIQAEPNASRTELLELMRKGEL